MKTRQLGRFTVSDISLGCMNLSHAYGSPPSEADAIALLNRALDAGYSMLDTAAVYGFGANETLIGKAVMHRRDEFVLASKGGMYKNAEGKREIKGRPDIIRKTCEEALVRLNTDVIDLYYLHRWDKNVPIEESVGLLSDLVAEGKIKTIGLSEVSSETLRKAHAVHPVTALQTEYSLWTRNPEISVLKTCEALGVAFVAFSPLARGFLADQPVDATTLSAGDFRCNMPRFEPENYAQNLKLLPDLMAIAEQHQCTVTQLSLAWVLAQSPNIIAIPGTTSIQHMLENAAASELSLDAETLAAMDAVINQRTVHGPRYNATTQTEIDTEEFV